MASALESPTPALVPATSDPNPAAGPASEISAPFSPRSDPSTPSLSVGGTGTGDARGLKSAWAGLGLDRQVVRNLDATPLVPEDLHKRIVRCILQAHHLEIAVPSGSSTTHVVQAAVISFVASKLKDSSPSPPHASPTVLVLCTNPARVERHSAAGKLLAREVEGLELKDMDHHESLSDDLEIARRSSGSRPIWITTLARVGILLQQQVLSVDRLSILVLDLRHAQQLNHHTVAELEPLLHSLGAHVQLIMLLSLNARVSPALSSLVTRKMEASIRINLNSHSTPSLSATSNSSTPSQPVSQIPSPPSAASHNSPIIHKVLDGNSFAENLESYQRRW
ncbi:hypothetical protein PCANC_14139 [Puccinia coronata f. sp. avenae]|uniref:Uncharacterized protein n=1 Tax=Puccinia coronata f. sp. avenae TaxID=200324 RepID=A0A2N5SVR1_9BASI|nr:hypothetical protein PCANC_14139 [Puccinia coronata f. sp. avenae]